MEDQVTVDRWDLEDLVGAAMPANERQEHALARAREALRDARLPREEIPGQMRLFDPDDYLV